MPTAADPLSTGPLAVRIDAALPQTQCRRCGYADCADYADAIARKAEAIDRCPPGGTEGVERLARIVGVAVMPLNPACGSEGPRSMAVIDEAWCIGCTLCLDACPTDAILGIHKRMHTVIEAHCTGCELCVPACPVDCIAMVPVTPGRSGWAAWSPTQAAHARERYASRRARLAKSESAPIAADASSHDESAGSTLEDTAKAKAAPGTGMETGAEAIDAAAARKRTVVEAALRKARAARAERD